MAPFNRKGWHGHSEITINKALNSFGGQYADLVADGRQMTKLPYNMIHEKLLEQLKKREMISSFSRKDEEYFIYFKRPRGD